MAVKVFILRVSSSNLFTSCWDWL